MRNARLIPPPRHPRHPPQDNTLAGAIKLLKRFNDFRSEEKRKLFSDQIKLEALLTNLATRLADNGRPAFAPADPAHTATARTAGLADLQDLEQKLGVELHAEVPRPPCRECVAEPGASQAGPRWRTSPSIVRRRIGMVLTPLLPTERARALGVPAAQPCGHGQGSRGSGRIHL